MATRGDYRQKHRLLKEGIGQPMLLVFHYGREGNGKIELTITGCELLPCHDNTRIVGGIIPSSLKSKGTADTLPIYTTQMGGKVARQYSSASTTFSQCQTTPATVAVVEKFPLS